MKYVTFVPEFSRIVVTEPGSPYACAIDCNSVGVQLAPVQFYIERTAAQLNTLSATTPAGALYPANGAAVAYVAALDLMPVRA